jgi:hypothetical protein
MAVREYGIENKAHWRRHFLVIRENDAFFLGVIGEISISSPIHPDICHIFTVQVR